jgi:hypothetical protein
MERSVAEKRLLEFGCEIVAGFVLETKSKPAPLKSKGAAARNANAGLKPGIYRTN